MAKNIANENIFGGLTGAPEAQTRPAPKTVPVDGAEVVIQQPGAKETRTARMQFILPPSLKTRITRAAKEQGVSVNELVNQLLEQYCSSVERGKQLKAKAAQLTGKAAVPLFLCVFYVFSNVSRKKPSIHMVYVYGVCVLCMCIFFQLHLI